MLEPRPLKSGLGKVGLESEALRMRLHGIWTAYTGTVRAGGKDEPHSQIQREPWRAVVGYDTISGKCARHLTPVSD